MPQYDLNSVCDECTSSTRRCAWGLCVHMKSCSEVGWLHAVLCVGASGRVILKLCVCVSSRPVSRSVLSLWGGSAEWWLLIAGRKLREKLWRLLMECGRQGCYLSRYCRSALSLHPLPISFSMTLLMYKSLLLCLKHLCVWVPIFVFLTFFPLYLCTVKYTHKNIDDCINHWCYIIYYRCTGHLFFIFYHINPVLCFCPYLTVHASKSS